MAKELNLENFDETIESWITLVDFWAPWCGPCQQMIPVLDELDTEIWDKVTIAKVDVDDNQEIAMRFWIMWIPNIVLFKDWKIVYSQSWVQSKEVLLAEINKVL